MPKFLRSLHILTFSNDELQQEGLIYEPRYWFPSSGSNRERLNLTGTHEKAEGEAYNEVSEIVPFLDSEYKTLTQRRYESAEIRQKIIAHVQRTYPTQDEVSISPNQTFESVPSTSGIAF